MKKKLKPIILLLFSSLFAKLNLVNAKTHYAEVLYWPGIMWKPETTFQNKIMYFIFIMFIVFIVFIIWSTIYIENMENKKKWLKNILNKLK